MKIRSREASLASLARWAAASAIGVLVVSATARLVPPAKRGATRPVIETARAETPRVGDAVVTVQGPSVERLELIAGPDGVVSLDGTAMRRLGVGDEVAIAPRAGVEADVFQVTRTGRDGIGGGWWLLDSTMFAEAQAVLVERKGFTAGWMQSPAFGDAFEWSFDAIGPGRMVSFPRATDLPGCGGTIDPPMGPEPPMEGLRQPMGDEQECAGCGAFVADIAFFYTPLVLERVESDLEDVGGDPKDAPDVIAIRLALESANTVLAMDNSDLPFGTRIVEIALTEFDESGENFLGRFAGDGDGDMDEIHAVRDEVGADACSLITLGNGGGGYCGVAYLGNGDSPGAAFNNVLWDCTGGYVFAHEFGHNVGLCHAAGDGGGCGEVTDCNVWEPTWAGCCRPDPTGPDSPSPSFNHGWRWVNELNVPACVCTVMAYGRSDGTPVTRVPYFSNPDVDYLGTPTGSPEDAEDGRWADNASVIRATMPGTTQYRCESASVGSPSGRLVAAGLDAADFFGISVATNGEIMTAGASRHDVAALNAGAVFVFADPQEPKDAPEEDDLGWIQVGKITPSDIEENERFGQSVAMWEDLLVVGAPYTARVLVDDRTGEVIEDHPLAGAASFWQGDGTGAYCRLDILQPEDLDDFDNFGDAVAIAGDIVAVSASRRDASDGDVEDAGAVWVYQRIGDALELIEVIEGDETDGRFGRSLAAAELDNGDILLVVGAPGETLEYGRIHPYRYVRVGDGQEWTAVPGSPEPGLWQDGRFGTSLAARGSDVIAGAPGANEGRGVARAFRLVAAELQSNGDLELGGNPGDEAGTAVAITEQFAAVSVPGHDVVVEIDDIEIELDDLGMVAVYGREPGTVGWDPQVIIRPLDLQPGDALGRSIAIAGNRLFAGAPEAEGTAESGFLSGAVYAVDVTVVVDCNENGTDDSIDIYTGESEDLNGDGVPDECETGNCDADIDGDGDVDGDDLGFFLVEWGDCPELEPGCVGDLDGNGVVNGSDLGLFFASWDLECDPPTP